MTDWNPNDPDATRVYYDLAAWSFDQQAELASTMADADIPHAWDNTELMVPEEFEDATDQLIAEVESRLGIVSVDDQNDPGDPDFAFERPAAIVLESDAQTTEYDLDDWSPPERDAVTNALTDAAIAFRWERHVVLVGTEDEAMVEALLDEIESGDYVDLMSARPATADEEQTSELMTTFFLAAERLRRDPLDADGLDHLRHATDVADPEAPPFGVAPKLWKQTCELADEVVDALVDGDDPDPQGVIEAAERLHELLRPNV